MRSYDTIPGSGIISVSGRAVRAGGVIQRADVRVRANIGADVRGVR